MRKEAGSTFEGHDNKRFLYSIIGTVAGHNVWVTQNTHYCAFQSEIFFTRQKHSRKAAYFNSNVPASISVSFRDLNGRKENTDSFLHVPLNTIPPDPRSTSCTMVISLLFNFLNPLTTPSLLRCSILGNTNCSNIICFTFGNTSSVSYIISNNPVTFFAQALARKRK